MRTIQNNIEKSQFELYEDGQMAGLVRYEMHGAQMWVLDTKISPLHHGAGLSDDLIAKVLADARRRRIGIVPYCHAVRQYMADRPHCVSLMPSEQPGNFNFAQGTKKSGRLPKVRTSGTTAVSMAGRTAKLSGQS